MIEGSQIDWGGHALLNGHLYRTMGHKATASVGAVIAHHTAPLQHVLTQVRRMEKVAKNAGRDAFALKIIKRAGGEVEMNGWWVWSVWTRCPRKRASGRKLKRRWSGRAPDRHEASTR